jgi:hypothetical protein
VNAFVVNGGARQNGRAAAKRLGRAAGVSGRAANQPAGWRNITTDVSYYQVIYLLHE